MTGPGTSDAPYYVQSDHVRGEPRFYWVEDSRMNSKYSRRVTEMTVNKRTAERQCAKLNKANGKRQ